MNTQDIVKRLEVIFKNLLTYLVIVQTALTWVIANGALDSFPTVSQYVLVAATGIGVAVTFIRRVTKVDEEDRGLLPTLKEGGA